MTILFAVIAILLFASCLFLGLLIGCNEKLCELKNEYIDLKNRLAHIESNSIVWREDKPIAKRIIAKANIDEEKQYILLKFHKKEYQLSQWIEPITGTIIEESSIIEWAALDTKTIY